ncbi:MAG: hypothetical protein QOH82_4346 [Mycobacterium sp.]|nr:hypothetical protein [Mycobacterium sp.]
MGGLGLPGLWLYLALVVAASVFLAVGTMRTLLRRYTAAVQPEWDRQGSDAASATARAAITDMYRVLGKQRPPAAPDSIDAEIRGQLNVLTSQRNTRVLDTRPRIPGLLWGGSLFGGVLLIGLLGLSRLDDRRSHMVLSSAIAILLGLLLFLIFWLDHPFGRQLGVTPATFDYTVQVFDGVDEEA